MLAVQATDRINNMHKKQAESPNNGVRNMEFGWFDSGLNCEQNGVGFVMIVSIFAIG